MVCFHHSDSSWNMKILENYNIVGKTTFHVDARARYYAEYDSVEELRSLLADVRFNNLPKLHMGGGSNMLFTTDFDGVVLHSNLRGSTFAPAQADGTVLATAAAGERWDDFVAAACRAGYVGIENLSLIPGSVGAAAVQNIGAYGVEFADRLHSVEALDTACGDVVTLLPEQLHYGYRQSLFKEPTMEGRYVVLGVTMRLSVAPEFRLEYGPLRELVGKSGLTSQDVRERVVDIRRAKLPDPDVEGNAGSFFKNPVVGESKFRELVAAYPSMPSYPLPDGLVKIPAGWLIENAGMKGATVGGAMVYPKQCLVIINTGEATAADVVALSHKVQSEVMRTFGVELQREVIFV
jgi:UDP-N-acetylmuramate dehydrogenase